MNEVQIIPFSAIYAKSFKELNESWINKFFELEDEDRKALDHPEKIIDDGGSIFIALQEEEPVGVCALKKASTTDYEFSKMAVAEHAQGQGIGKKLLEAAITKAKSIGARRIFLEGNTLLEASIHLYRKTGFKEIPHRHSRYKRVNIVMEMLLD